MAAEVMILLTDRYAAKIKKNAASCCRGVPVFYCIADCSMLIADYLMRHSPVISAGWGRPMIFSIVGQMSARRPPSFSSQG